MQLITDYNLFKADPSLPLVLGLGNFDGIHLGHQALIQHVLTVAKKEKGIPAIFTFQNHPHSILRPEATPKILTSPEYKLFQFFEMGIQLCFWQTFTQDFSEITARQFVEDVLVKKLKVHEVCMGFNAHFGFKREGDVEKMQAYSDEFGFKFEQIKPIQEAGDYISSSRIRDLIKRGLLQEAESCLGRSFSILGKVSKGDGRGSQIGFPTANLQIESDILPPEGVYAVKARVVAPYGIKGSGIEKYQVEGIGKWELGVMNFGVRPTFKEGESASEAMMEVHLLDFEGDLSGKYIEVQYYSKLRQEKKFGNSEELVEQIQRDIVEARKLLI